MNTGPTLYGTLPGEQGGGRRGGYAGLYCAFNTQMCSLTKKKIKHNLIHYSCVFIESLGMSLDQRRQRKSTTAITYLVLRLLNKERAKAQACHLWLVLKKTQDGEIC